MNDIDLLKQLSEEAIINSESTSQIEENLANRPFSLYWELRTLLYAGITLLSTGVGILLYQNIDTIGHSILIVLIAVLCVGFFFYSFKNSVPFNTAEVQAEDKLQDFALLGACISFLSLGTYLQFQYTFFGERYGLATLIPALLFLALAYRFDHRGVLSMGITALASSIGLSIAPLKLLEDNDFFDLKLLLSAIFLGLGLIGVGILSERNNFKKHFSFTYLFFGGNLAFVAGLSAIFNFELKFATGIFIIVLALGYIYYARLRQSYIFMLMGVIYGYITITYHTTQGLDFFDESLVWIMYYYLASAGGVIYFLIKLKEIVKGKSK